MLSCIWRGFQSWDSLLDSKDDSSIDKVETSLERQERFSQFQDTTDALPCHSHLPVCLWIMDSHSRVIKKNANHGNEMLPQNTTISYKYHVTNKEVCAKIHLEIGPYEDLLTVVKRRILKWYGHVSRFSGLDKTILQGRVKGGRRQGRQKNRWEDDIREWTGQEFAKLQRAMENRERTKKLFVKLSEVLQRPSRLRDRRRWRWREQSHMTICRRYICIAMGNCFLWGCDLDADSLPCVFSHTVCALSPALRVSDVTVPFLSVQFLTWYSTALLFSFGFLLPVHVFSCVKEYTLSRLSTSVSVPFSVGSVDLAYDCIFFKNCLPPPNYCHFHCCHQLSYYCTCFYVAWASLRFFVVVIFVVAVVVVEMQRPRNYLESPISI